MGKFRIILFSGADRRNGRNEIFIKHVDFISWNGIVFFWYKMKKIVMLTVILLSWVFITYTETQIKYYRLHTVKTIRGKILNITVEKSYHRSEFTVIYLKTKKSEELFRVEVSPTWYSNLVLKKGDNIEVNGSFAKINDNNLIMTKSISFNGEIYQFRDKYGFPLWRGKGKYMKGHNRRRRKRGNR